MHRKKDRNWRSQATHDRFHAYIDEGHLENACALCSLETIQEFTYWRTVENTFPYDAVASLHHMVLPIRHTDGEDLSFEETEELRDLKKSILNDDYNFVLECLPKAKSIPEHFHLHLLVPKAI